jgi:hypothetical protein
LRAVSRENHPRASFVRSSTVAIGFIERGVRTLEETVLLENALVRAESVVVVVAANMACTE